MKRIQTVFCLAAAGFVMAGAAVAAEQHATVPLKSLAELEAWRPATAPWNRASEPLRRRVGADDPLADLWIPVARGQDRRADVIVMHDMMGGYRPDQDGFPGGSGNDRLYRFTHWQYIDAFVYFAHDRVSFPPPGWTDSAHRNGVLSLGTFDIEGRGPVPTAELRELLDDAERRSRYAAKLAEIARVYGFDGYLVNIERELPGADQARLRRARSLKAFVKELRAAVKKDKLRAKVIWYDSITRSGELAYQNELNDENKPFFARSDGITVNYDWSPPLNDGSPKRSAQTAGARRLQVYSSVDAFCRESPRRYCGWSSYLGAGAAVRAGTSFGVFGPGWTYEGDGSRPDHADFALRDRRFWVGTAGDRRPEKGVAAFVAARPIPSDLPFTTHFGQGLGKAVYRRGAVAKAGAWGNVGRIDVLPTWLETAVPGSGAYDAALTADAAFEGGSSLRIAARGTPAGYTLRPLFRTAFGAAGTLTYTVRGDGLDLALVVVAADREGSGTPEILVLKPAEGALPHGVDYGLAAGDGKAAVRVVRPAATALVNGWSRRTYDLSTPLRSKGIGAIGLLAYPKARAPEAASVLLGEITMR
jgi:mannosyl-glycoprotein endo-beta-N-acetylglucosaminidase